MRQFASCIMRNVTSLPRDKYTSPQKQLVLNLDDGTAAIPSMPFKFSVISFSNLYQATSTVQFLLFFLYSCFHHSIN